MRRRVALCGMVSGDTYRDPATESVWRYVPWPRHRVGMEIRTVTPPPSRYGDTYRDPATESVWRYVPWPRHRVGMEIRTVTPPPSRYGDTYHNPATESVYPSSAKCSLWCWYIRECMKACSVVSLITGTQFVTKSAYCRYCSLFELVISGPLWRNAL